MVTKYHSLNRDNLFMVIRCHSFNRYNFFMATKYHSFNRDNLFMEENYLTIMISISKRSSFRLYLPLFVGRLMFYLHYLCLFAHNGVQHTLCCVFVLFFFVLCILCCQFLWIVHFWLPLQYSLTFIYSMDNVFFVKTKPESL